MRRGTGCLRVSATRRVAGAPGIGAMAGIREAFWRSGVFAPNNRFRYYATAVGSYKRKPGKRTFHTQVFSYVVGRVMVGGLSSRELPRTSHSGKFQPYGRYQPNDCF